jgi:hypothetical protein
LIDVQFFVIEHNVLRISGIILAGRTKTPHFALRLVQPLSQSILGLPAIPNAMAQQIQFLSGQTAVTAQGTLFDGVVIGQPPRDWHGAGNVYALWAPWPSIEQLRSEWKSPEEGSLEVDPAVFDPGT